jgi:demethylmenaquinone methyltransferase/2-methoxy-6-polyprenyl-1,4-benzoquinol methylase
MPPVESKNRAKTESTHFGYRDVDSGAKPGMVNEVFDSVASRYDVMNDLMSFGIHRAWKAFTLARSGVRPGQRVLDVAGGSGDLSIAFARRVGRDGTVVLTDINAAMLAHGRRRVIDAGHIGTVVCVQTDAENLAFADASFDCISIAFGLRNVTHIDRALASMYRVLRPGGRLLILEFSKPKTELLRRFYDAYSFAVIPKLGAAVTGDRESYQYLVESIRRHPDQPTLKAMMRDAGFEDVKWHDLSGGIVALHVGYKY